MKIIQLKYHHYKITETDISDQKEIQVEFSTEKHVNIEICKNKI